MDSVYNNIALFGTMNRDEGGRGNEWVKGDRRYTALLTAYVKGLRDNN